MCKCLGPVQVRCGKYPLLLLLLLDEFVKTPWISWMLSLKWFEFFRCCFWNSLSFPSVVLETISVFPLQPLKLCFPSVILKQSEFTQCCVWNSLFTQSFETISLLPVSVCFWKKSEFPQYCLWNTFSFLFQCCLETVLIAHCCFWNSISFLNFVFEAVSVSLMFFLKQSHFPSTVFEAISVCLTSPVLSLKQSQFPRYCLWKKLISPLLSFETVSSFPDSLNFPSFVFGTVSVASSLSWNSFTFVSVVFQNKIRFHNVVSEAALVSPKRLASVLIVVLKQFDYLQCCLWNNLRFPSVVSEAVVASPKRLASVLIVVLKQFYFPQCCLWNNLRFPSVVSEAVVMSPKRLASVLIVVLKQFYFPQCCLWNNLRFPIVVSGVEQKISGSLVLGKNRETISEKSQ